MNSVAKPKNITEYINSFPEEIQVRLHELLNCLKEVAPGAEESLK